MTGMTHAMEIGSAGAPEPLGEGNSFAVAAPDHPIKRVVAVSIKASLNDLCLQKARGTWAPSQEALRNICKLHHSNHFGTDGLRPNVGDTERACCSFAQSSNANCESCPPPPRVPLPSLFHAGCRRFASVRPSAAPRWMAPPRRWATSRYVSPSTLPPPVSSQRSQMPTRQSPPATGGEAQPLMTPNRSREQSMVLHDLKITHVKSNFPVALGKLCPPPQLSPR